LCRPTESCSEVPVVKQRINERPDRHWRVLGRVTSPIFAVRD
jgi:hypothetical protein